MVDFHMFRNRQVSLSICLIVTAVFMIGCTTTGCRKGRQLQQHRQRQPLRQVPLLQSQKHNPPPKHRLVHRKWPQQRPQWKLSVPIRLLDWKTLLMIWMSISKRIGWLLKWLELRKGINTPRTAALLNSIYLIQSVMPIKRQLKTMRYLWAVRFTRRPLKMGSQYIFTITRQRI